MDTYRDMYYKLFDATMRAMELLVEAHKETEKMLMLAEEPDLRALPRPGEGEGEPPEEL